MKKKTVLVETAKWGKNWSIKVTSTIPELRVRLGGVIKTFADDFDADILNATDPFGDTISKRKRKIHNADSRKEAIEALDDLKQAVLKS